MRLRHADIRVLVEIEAFVLGIPNLKRVAEALVLPAAEDISVERRHVLILFIILAPAINVPGRRGSDDVAHRYYQTRAAAHKYIQ